MLSSLVSLGLGTAADAFLWSAAKTTLPVAKTIGGKIIQKVGCAACSAGVTYALDQMISEVAEPVSRLIDASMGIYIIDEEETK